MSDVILSESPAPHVRLVTLNRPEQLNAINSDLCAALHEELRSVAADRSCRAVIMTGRRARLLRRRRPARLREAPGNDGTDQARDHFANQEHMSRLILRVRATPQPVIAAVNGGAAGFGIALACASDIRYAARKRGLSRRLHQHRPVELRHGNELAAAAPDRRLPRPRADADRPAPRRRRGCAHRAGRRRRRRRPAPGACGGGRRAGRCLGAVGRSGSPSRACGRRSRSHPSRRRSSTRTASRSWLCTGPRPARRSARISRSARRTSPTEPTWPRSR